MINLERCVEIAPVFFDMDISLVFRMINMSSLSCPILFKASSAIPEGNAPSPIMATTAPFSPFIRLAILTPCAAESEVEECPAPKISYGDSSLFR